MSWYAVEVRSPDAERERVAAWLVGKTGHAVEERDDGTLIGAVENQSEADALLRGLQDAFRGQAAGASHPLPDIDWRLRWRDGLGPRRIGRLTIAPSWSVVDPAAVTVVIDPETAFGSGAHGSTRAMLALLDQVIRPGDRVLDLGSGSGILAIAALKLGAARAIGIDFDPESEPVALANARRNGVAEGVEFLTGDATVLAPLLAPVDLVLANTIRSLNQVLLPLIEPALASEGRVVFGGMERAERELFLPLLGEHGLRMTHEARDEQWWAVAARLE